MRVLIVEDNAGDAFMIEEMLNELKMELKIMIVKDGVEAMTLLQNKQNRGSGPCHPRPQSTRDGRLR